MKKTNKHPLTFFRESGEARKKLIKKFNGGPGSGMGSMYLNDLANDAMMAEPPIQPTAELKINPNAYNIDSKYLNFIPASGDKYLRGRDIMELLERRSQMDQKRGPFKKGGSVKRKKK